MNGKITSITFKQATKFKSNTDWERVRNNEPDMTDPDAPDFSGVMVKEVKKITKMAISDSKIA